MYIAFKTIGELEVGVAEALKAVGHGLPLPSGLECLRHLAPPPGLAPKVSFHYVSGRDIRSDSPSANLPRHLSEGGSVRIEFVAVAAAGTNSSNTAATAERNSDGMSVEDTRLRDLILALDLAERDPAFPHFVALKPFRDTFLARQGYSWAASPENRHNVLRTAIERNWVLKSSVHNPKSPQFPVTTIRVNRSLPEVAAILESGLRASPFAPVRFEGEPLSRTVINERR